jgi:hypothetical protein
MSNQQQLSYGVAELEAVASVNLQRAPDSASPFCRNEGSFRLNLLRLHWYLGKGREADLLR